MSSDDRANLSEAVPVEEQLDISARIAVASRHWMSAAYMAARAAEVERLGHTGDDSRAIHCAYVTGAVVLSACFLEAAINEFCLDCIGRSPPDDVASLAPSFRAKIALLWSEVPGTGKTLERHPILERYQIVLGESALLANPGAGQFDRGSDPLQSADLAICLRDYVAHSKSASMLVSSSNPQVAISLPKLARQSRARIKANEFVRGLSFPDSILSADCARFAHAACDALAREFFLRIGMQPRYATLSRPDLARSQPSTGFGSSLRRSNGVPGRRT